MSSHPFGLPFFCLDCGFAANKSSSRIRHEDRCKTPFAPATTESLLSGPLFHQHSKTDSCSHKCRGEFCQLVHENIELERTTNEADIASMEIGHKWAALITLVRFSAYYKPKDVMRATGYEVGGVMLDAYKRAFCPDIGLRHDLVSICSSRKALFNGMNYHRIPPDGDVVHILGPSVLHVLEDNDITRGSRVLILVRSLPGFTTNIVSIAQTRHRFQDWDVYLGFCSNEMVCQASTLREGL
ncbi:MAG: hypothetical protein MMC23_003773 [Stictis urceolatum]|nr:hypothetical protein [Stictis urceolata]